MDKISVIIPVYRVGAYLDACVCSVVDQTYKNLEIILVDDGSPDRCSQLCDAWAKKDKRIRVIHKNNSGLAAARNSGLAAASGEYVLFLDSDDFWDNSGMLECLVKRVKITGPDVLNFSYFKYYTRTGKKVPRMDGREDMPLSCSTKKQQLDYLMSRHLYIASACNKMIRRNILDASMVFREGVYSEDIDWCARLLLRAASLDFIGKSFYCYRQRESSISHAITEKTCADLCANIEKCAALMKEADPDMKPFLAQYTAYQYGTFFAVQAMAEDRPEKYIAKMEEHKDLLSSHGGNTKVRILQLLCRTIGYQGTCRLLRGIYKKKRRT